MQLALFLLLSISYTTNAMDAKVEKLSDKVWEACLPAPNSEGAGQTFFHRVNKILTVLQAENASMFTSPHRALQKITGAEIASRDMLVAAVGEMLSVRELLKKEGAEITLTYAKKGNADIPKLLTDNDSNIGGWLTLAFMHKLHERCQGNEFGNYRAGRLDPKLDPIGMKLSEAAIFVAALGDVIDFLERNKGSVTIEVYKAVKELSQKAFRQLSPTGKAAGDDANAQSVIDGALLLSGAMEKNYRARNKSLPLMLPNLLAMEQGTIDQLKSLAGPQQPSQAEAREEDVKAEEADAIKKIKNMVMGAFFSSPGFDAPDDELPAAIRALLEEVIAKKDSWEESWIEDEAVVVQAINSLSPVDTIAAKQALIELRYVHNTLAPGHLIRLTIKQGVNGDVDDFLAQYPKDGNAVLREVLAFARGMSIRCDDYKKKLELAECFKGSFKLEKSFARTLLFTSGVSKAAEHTGSPEKYAFVAALAKSVVDWWPIAERAAAKAKDVARADPAGKDGGWNLIDTKLSRVNRIIKGVQDLHAAMVKDYGKEGTFGEMLDAVGEDTKAEMLQIANDVPETKPVGSASSSTPGSICHKQKSRKMHGAANTVGTGLALQQPLTLVVVVVE